MDSAREGGLYLHILEDAVRLGGGSGDLRVVFLFAVGVSGVLGRGREAGQRHQEGKNILYHSFQNLFNGKHSRAKVTNFPDIRKFYRFRTFQTSYFHVGDRKVERHLSLL